MGKIEKTLELNITHEILSLADSFWWYLQPISLKKYWRPHWRFPFIQAPKSFATGLHINLEGKKNGGYDVCIHSPSNFQGGTARLLFMQFKAGIEKQFNDNPKSIFFGDKSHPNIHIEFDLNSNKNHNQHKLLQDISAKAGNKDAAVYVFPHMVNEDQLTENIGKLLTKTSFISVSEIDDKANVYGFKIDDGHSHKLGTSYHDYNNNEVNFFFFFFGKPKEPGGVLGEIFAIRIYRALEVLRQAQLPNFPISKYHIIDALIRHLFNIGIYFSIPIRNLQSSLKEFNVILSRLNFLKEYEELPLPYIVNEEINNYFSDIFQDISNSLLKYLSWLEYLTEFNNKTFIPLPDYKYTIELPLNGIRFALSNEINDIDIDSLNEISYTIL